MSRIIYQQFIDFPDHINIYKQIIWLYMYADESKVSLIKIYGSLINKFD